METKKEFAHVSVMLQETVDALVTDPDGIYVDGTLGGAGHSYEVCRRLSEKGRLIGIDQDAEAVAAASQRLKPFEGQVTVIRSNYAEMVPGWQSWGSARWTGSCWIWEFPPISWTSRNAVLPTGMKTLPWICGWTRDSG